MLTKLWPSFISILVHFVVLFNFFLIVVFSLSWLLDTFLIFSFYCAEQVNTDKWHTEFLSPKYTSHTVFLTVNKPWPAW